MEYGFCTGFATKPLFTMSGSLNEKIIRSGFYPEFPVMAIAGICEEDYESYVAGLSGIKTPTACNFFPSSLPLLGNAESDEAVKAYLSLVLPRLGMLGVKSIVLGSGKARMKGLLSHEEAENAFSVLLKTVVLPRVSSFGMKVLIEPLSYGECDWLNTAKESAAFVKKVNDPGLSLMVDLFHMENNGESEMDLYDLYPLIGHVHVAGTSRALFTSSFDPFIGKALQILKECGYSKSVSFETADAPEFEMVNARRLIGSVFEEN